MGIAKSENTVSDTHGGGRIRSALARAAGAGVIESAIGGLGDESTISEGMPGWVFPISQGNFAASDGDPDETSRRTLSGLSAKLERLTGDPNGRCDSLNRARTSDQMSTGDARVLRKGKLGEKRNDLTTPRRDG